MVCRTPRSVRAAMIQPARASAAADRRRISKNLPTTATSRLMSRVYDRPELGPRRPRVGVARSRSGHGAQVERPQAFLVGYGRQRQQLVVRADDRSGAEATPPWRLLRLGYVNSIFLPRCKRLVQAFPGLS